MTYTPFKTSLKLTAATLAFGAMTAPAAFAAPAVSTDTKISAQFYTKVADNSRRDRVRPDRPRRVTPDRPTRRDRVERRTRDDSSRTGSRDRLRREITRDVRRDTRRSDRNRVRRDHYRRASYRPHRSYTRRHYAPYRSNIGISFSFGNAGYSPYRWATSPYSLYRPGRMSYASYSGATRCHRVILDGWYHGRPAPVSVKQCYNPFDGSYIIQGSERLVRRGY